MDNKSISSKDENENENLKEFQLPSKQELTAYNKYFLLIKGR